MDSIGTINTNYIVDYDENCKFFENFQNLDNKFIITVKSSNLDDVISLFQEPNFVRFIHEAFNCFIVCVEFDNNDEEEEVDDEYTAMRLEGIFKADPDIILQLNQNLWIKKYFQKKFFNMRSSKMRKYQQLLEDLHFDENILNAKLKLSSAIDYIRPETDEFVIKIIKLFKFDNQKEVDKKLFEVAIEQKCSFEIIQSMISFHKESSNGMSKYEVDALFLAKGIKVFDVEIIDNYKQELRKEEKEKITDEIEKFHGNKRSLLQHICSRSRIALNNKETEDERLQKFEEYYSQLIDLNVDSVTDLLKIVDHKLLIVFDFDSNSIERSYLMGSKSNRGIFDQDRMKIFIGAKNSFDPSSQDYKIREWEIIGILIHEISHYVNFKVFNNNCKPYHKDNNRQEYEEIINEYNVWTDHHEIVRRVFSDYEETMWHAELIVRAVQMIVTYKVLDPKNLEKLEIKYQKLFAYFNGIVMTQIKEFLNPDNQLKRITEKISLFKLDQLEIKPIMQPLNYDKEKYIHFVETNTQMLAMTNFRLNFQDDFTIFTTFTDLMDEFIGTGILSLWCSDWRIKIVILCDEINENSKHFEECINKLDNPDRLNQIFIIFEERSENTANLKELFTKRIEILEKLNFSFSDLTDESKETILEKTAIFQGNQTTLNEIFTKNSKAAQFLPINHFLESSEPIVIGKLPEKNADYDDKVFIHREFTNKNEEQVVEFSTEEMDEILTLLSTRQYIIISDEVGKGKSTLMTYLAYQFLQSSLSHIEGKFFVVKINLHQHAKLLENFKDDTPVDKFIFDNFVSNSKFKKLEWEIFEEYYRNGKIILMLDGFDEIAGSPNSNKNVTRNCEESIFKIIQETMKLKTSNVIIATRPLFVSNLSISNAYVLNLLPLTFQDQFKYLITHLKSHEEIQKNYSDSDIAELCHKSLLRMLTSVKETNSMAPKFMLKTNFYNFMMSFPLHLKMFADVILNKVLKNKFNFDEALKSITSFNVYDLYDDFFGIKQAIALKDKGEIVENEITNLKRKGLKKLQLFDCAGKLAWNTLHPAFKSNPIKINEREKKYLQRYGIVTMQNNEIYFVHRSYAEFFIAYMFLENITDGTLSSSNFAQDHFWIDILTLVEYEIIKSLIDAALSEEDNYREISEECLHNLGKFILREFEELEGNDKNFLHCIIEHEKKNKLKMGLRKDFVFISHLLLESLLFCDSDDDIKTIKNILENTWIESGDNNPSDIYQNIFHLSCSLGINCLVSVIWELAKKIYEVNAKSYFLTSYSNGFELKNVLELALHIQTISSLYLNKCCVNVRNCYSMKKLRGIEDLEDEENIDLNKECNFDLSTVFLLLQIIEKFELTEEELNFISHLQYNNKTDATMINIFLKINAYYYFLYNFLIPKGSKIANDFKLEICSLLTSIVSYFNNNVEQNMKDFFSFLKTKLSNEYTIFIKYFFQIYFERDLIPVVFWTMYAIEQKGKIIYSELKDVLNSDLNISNFFLYDSRLTSPFIISKDYNDIIIRLQIYFKVLDDDHLILFLSNESFKNINIINYIVLSFLIEDVEHFLQFLESRFFNKQKLYTAVKKSNMLANSTMNEEKFSKVYEFCKKNFGDSKTHNLILMIIFNLRKFEKMGKKILEIRNIK